MIIQNRHIHFLNMLKYLKAHSMIGMIKRSVGFNSPFDVERKLYLAHVRSLLESDVESLSR